MFAGECDKRKEQLLQLQRSKLDRHMRELHTLKKVRCMYQPSLPFSWFQIPPSLPSFLPPSLPPSPSFSQMCGHQEQEISSLRNQLRAANKPHPPAPPAIERGGTGSSVMDELTELLERAGIEQPASLHPVSHSPPTVMKHVAVSLTSRAAVSPLSTPLRAPLPSSSSPPPPPPPPPPHPPH